mmetsp:Transcript_2793/g.7367  ORF Transcript_2793/g.7367 Transcript_2793/m.7367 type:complete len:327 (+) Transcript_2793:75-1055(+)
MSNIGFKAVASAAVVALWTQWRLATLDRAGHAPSAIEWRWFSLLMCQLLRFYSWVMGVRILSESGEGLQCDPARRYMITWHPHGFIVYCPIFLLAEHSIRGTPTGGRWHCTGAPIMFKTPGIGDLIQVLGGRPVDKKTLTRVMDEGGGVAIQPGGMAEQAATRHDQEAAYFPANLGFIRMAIKYGTPLVILYVFGENQLYKRSGNDGGFYSKLTVFIKKLTGMTVPIVTAKFGIPMAMLLPIRTDIHARWGSPVEVGPPEEHPSDERVEEVFARYLEELRRVFYANAHDCLPPEVAARGLKIVRADGKPVPEWAPGPSATAGRSKL